MKSPGKNIGENAKKTRIICKEVIINIDLIHNLIFFWKMKFKIRDLRVLFKKTFIEWYKKDPFRQSAVMAYYAIFAMPGLLFLVVTLTGYFFDKDAVNEKIVIEVSSTVGTDTGAQISDMLMAAGETKSTVWGSIVGIVILLIGATGVFVELQKTLDIIWEVKVVPQRGMMRIVKTRLFSFGLILVIAFLLLISLVISTVLAAVTEKINVDTSTFMIAVFAILNFIFSMAVISLLFALMFKILPDAKVKWNHVWLGALLTGILFTIGKTALAFYFGMADPASGYGAAGSIILILLWVSYSSMILFFGAEFTASYAKMYTGKVAPTEIAKVMPQSEVDKHTSK